jgi:hypothetical protein
VSEEARAVDVDHALTAIRELLARYKFVVPNERSLQNEVMLVLAHDARIGAEREVRGDHGAFDVCVTFTEKGRPAVVVVIELKVRGSAAAVERQAQRYAKVESVDAVVVVTTSQRLQAALLGPQNHMLGGKPFRALALRTF